MWRRGPRWSLTCLRLHVCFRGNMIHVNNIPHRGICDGRDNKTVILKDIIMIEDSRVIVSDYGPKKKKSGELLYEL